LVLNTGLIKAFTCQSGANQSTSSTAGDIATATWYTVGVSRSGAAIKLYKNGVDVTVTAQTHINPVTSARTAVIGAYNDKTGYFLDGKMEFLRIFGGISLSASEHLAYHNALA
jgi:hypothetical protein